MTQSEFCNRFVDSVTKYAGFREFGDGEDVAAYAGRIAATYWEEPDLRSEGPEACAEAEVDSWGEE